MPSTIADRSQPDLRLQASHSPAAPTSQRSPTRSFTRLMRKPFVPYVLSAMVVALAALTASLVSIVILEPNVAVLLLTAVLATAILWGLGPALFASALGVAVQSFIFYPPIYSFRVDDPRQLLETPPPVFAVGDLQVDQIHRRVLLGGADVRLSPKQYNLLTILVRHAGKVVTHHQLLNEIWGPAHTGDIQYLRVFVRKLRNKIEADPAQPRYLLTELGVGYRLRAPE